MYTCTFLHMCTRMCCLIWREREKSARGKEREGWINVHIIQNTQIEMDRGREGRRD